MATFHLLMKRIVFRGALIIDSKYGIINSLSLSIFYAASKPLLSHHHDDFMCFLIREYRQDRALDLLTVDLD